MATLKLNKKPAPAAKTGGGERRAPVRGTGVSRSRPTLAQAQADRAERQAAFEQRRAEEGRAEREAARPARPSQPAARPAAKPAFRREEPAAPQAPRRDQRRATGPAAFDAPSRPPRPQRPVEPSPEGERLSKRMSELGLASRREADEWIAAGYVRVDGRVAELGQRVGPEVRIEIAPEARGEQAARVTILLHKPIGYVSGQAEDGYEPAAALIKPDTHWKDDASGLKFNRGQLRNLAPAGRLDIDSTGLLVLTQDGRIAKALIGEDSLVEKEYLVRVEYGARPDAKAQEGFPEQDLDRLRHGLELDGVQLKPAQVSWANEDQLRFVLREGRKRQIRRMCELVGLKVVGLKRVRIGRIPLGKLPQGQWRYLMPWERF
ncbi:pseudouridine synthase [Pelomonas sp. SE-A7]|uniref:pseudouridine synthase n=1 Tax=Pelomonas sp. SE-A7 TaxID=3054953 RepID=UPI00338F9EE2